jgi:hypothetical protein
MVGEYFGENHPSIIPYNNDLIELYGNMENEEKKSQILPICNKSISICESHFE